jgi:hypothetical protein
VAPIPEPLDGWKDTAATLRSREVVPAAQANAELLDRAMSRWRTHVAVRSSMHDLVFTRLASPTPREKSHVQVSWRDGVYEFRLVDSRGLLITADRCYAGNASVVLDSFLFQLAGEPAIDTHSVHVTLRNLASRTSVTRLSWRKPSDPSPSASPQRRSPYVRNAPLRQREDRLAIDIEPRPAASRRPRSTPSAAAATATGPARRRESRSP